MDAGTGLHETGEVAPLCTPDANEARLRESFQVVPDPHERLMLITDACSGTGIPAASRDDSFLVPGCVSKVWLQPTRESGALGLQFAWDAESSLVRGLAGLICRVYQGIAPEVADRFRTTLLSDLGLDRMLSPTRLRGLASVEARIHELARSIARDPL